ncbi:MAG: aminopeptidase N, partial [Xanthomonadales bacterium]|nr:aminopeptidase N [Xanthomonadales bacterium]
MKQGAARKAIYRKDYTPWPWTLHGVELHFDIGDDGTRVTAELQLERSAGEQGTELVLYGRELETLSVSVDGEALSADRFQVDDETLTVSGVPGRFTLRTEVRIHPERNTALEGLYASDGFLLTQCEAQGFRKITWFPDRPDVMTRYEVTIEADRGRYPVLLSNGNLVGEGDAGDGRHWTRWEDPFPKPSYLFALVAGDLACVEDH